MSKKRDNKIKRQNVERMKSKFNFIKYDDYELSSYDKHEIFMYGGIRKDSATRKELETVKWIETMTPGDRLFDVGANIGAYSLIAAANGMKVYAFEPSATNFVVLLKNIIKNKFESDIIPLSVPLAEKSSLDYFNYYDLSAGASIHVFGEPIDYTGSEFKPVFRQLTMSSTIDDLVFTYGVEGPTHLKIDVDGNELQILKGAKRVLATDDLQTICIEVMEKLADEAGITSLFVR